MRGWNAGWSVHEKSTTEFPRKINQNFHENRLAGVSTKMKQKLLTHAGHFSTVPTTYWSISANFKICERKRPTRAQCPKLPNTHISSHRVFLVDKIVNIKVDPSYHAFFVICFEIKLFFFFFPEKKKLNNIYYSNVSVK